MSRGEGGYNEQRSGSDKMGSATQRRSRADRFRWRPGPASAMKRLQADMAMNHLCGEPQKRFQKKERLTLARAGKGQVLWG